MTLPPHERPPLHRTAAAPAQRVLVVDDNFDAADSLALLLEMDGHVTHVCADAHGALAALQGFEPSVVLLDVGLPGLSGAQFAAHLQALPPVRRPLLVALVGVADEAAALDGFAVHLSKPVEPALLQRVLAGHRH